MSEKEQERLALEVLAEVEIRRLCTASFPDLPSSGKIATIIKAAIDRALELSDDDGC